MLTPQEIAGRSIMIRIPGTELDAETADFIRRHHIRAICLFRQNMANAEQLKKLTADLRAVMGEHALIAIDQEGGAVVRSTWVPQPPAAMSLGASDDPALCREIGAAVARALKALGFNWNFAPVLDLNNNAHNPVIAERSFGSHPERAAELALAWMEGSLSEGVACCVKHFPGHGDTHVDSHRELPRVDKPLAELEALELVPFKRAATCAPAMMSAHIVYSALDPQHPATLSKAILTDMLRKEWGYRGVIITDGMDMHAIAGRYGVGAAAVQAFEAGADMVMALGTRETQIETLQTLTAAILEGRIDPNELLIREHRLEQLCEQYPCVDHSYIGEVDDRILMENAWRRGLTLAGEASPPAHGSKVRLVVSRDVVSDGVSEAGVPGAVVADLLRRFYEVEVVHFDDATAFVWTQLPKDNVPVILASTTRIRYPKCVRENWHPDLHLALWNPFQVLDVDAPALMTYGFAPPALAAVASWFAGETIAAGKMPVADFFA